jgi:hypothetical protein
VMDILGVDCANAISWVEQRFEVPLIPARKPHERAEHRRLEGVIDPITLLVRSHVFSRLSMPARLIAPVLVGLSEKNAHFAEADRTIDISYRALMRYSGLKSPNAVSKGIEELKVIGWMRGGSDAAGLVRATGSYVLSPFADPLLELGHVLAKEEQMLIVHERQQSKRRRQERERIFRGRTQGRNAGAKRNDGYLTNSVDLRTAIRGLERSCTQYMGALERGEKASGEDPNNANSPARSVDHSRPTRAESEPEQKATGESGPTKAAKENACLWIGSL